MPPVLAGWPAALALALLPSLAVTGWLATRGRGFVLDLPGHRSLHARPTPRTGGIGLLAGLLAGAGWHALVSASSLPPLAGPGELLALGLLVTVSFLDDLGHVPIPVRLLVQAAVAWVLALYSGLSFLAALLAMPAMVWMVNLYNFMDGMDGFAGGMAVFGFGTLAGVAWLAGQPQWALLPALVVAAALGFLAWNFPPARIFLGDAGATLLGMLAAWLLLEYHLHGLLPLWLGVLLFAPFVFDATVTLLRRILRGERFWEAHRTHYYQRLVQRGWGHRRTVLVEYLLMAGCSLTVLLVFRRPAPVQWAAVLAWGLVAALLMGWVDAEERRTKG
ncbi:MAG: glycosyltransferase family 4 protein [Gammaproteobacteria bacterium]|nr:MAG: glycosyltransferase family 4 protein [Gammaproteobacteria bacterium]